MSLLGYVKKCERAGRFCAGSGMGSILATMGVPNRDFGNDGAEIGKDKASDGHLNFVLVTSFSDFWERSEQKSGFGC